MDQAFSKGFPFEIGDVWRQSTFQLDDSKATLFRRLETGLPTLDVQPPQGLFKEDFVLPELGEIDGYDNQDAQSLRHDPTDPVDNWTDRNELPESTADVWSLDITLNGAERIPRLHTWEAFDKKILPITGRKAYVTEAGRTVFDAAVRRIENRPADSGILPQDVLLKALSNLALGRSSLFFRWNEGKRSFVRTLTEIPMSGYSAASSDSLILQMIGMGTRFRLLVEYSRSVHSRKVSSPAMTALKGCILKILDCVEQYVTKRIPQIKSIVQLCCTIDRSHQLLMLVEALTGTIEHLRSDEDVISTISSHVNKILVTETCYAGVLQVLLARVSAPWLERLCVDLGLSEDRLHQSPIAHESIDVHAAKNLNYSPEISGSETQELPDFVDAEDRALILQCKRSLAALRQQLPEHKLDPTQSAHLTSLLVGSGDQDRHTSDSDLEAPIEQSEILAWSDGEAQIEYLGSLDSRMSQQPMLTEQAADELETGVESALYQHSGMMENSTVLNITAFNPIESLRPIIQSHARLINEMVLRHLFWTCQLRHNLDIQHQFHLFGNGDFVARLSTALFSTETQSAERKKGNVPTGETMGLRLGTRDGQRWPPASSELRLTLAGVLTETCRRDLSTARSTQWDAKELPGGLSFSIRELPDDEIERVLDPRSIYALDFLCLQYHPPPGLEAVMTASCMQTYDGIFRHLLRLARVLDITVDAKIRSKVKRIARKANAASIQRFVLEAHHFISVLMSYVMDLGIEVPWRAFLASVDEVEASFKDKEKDRQNGTTLGLDDLRQLHEQCLDSIRTRLFMRRKHEKIRTGIEHVFTAILQTSAALETNEAGLFDNSYADFQEAIAKLFGVLRTAVNRPGKAKADMSAAEEETDAMSLFFERLNWNEYYRDMT